ncbi:5'-nucleotidase C-terminal domain-containing protein [Cytobacillus firmus]|uniref:5'-nucleotidase C-terminal domain-containing protein n=1 Tax=Cytobacillus firmus TaxID=1399 RepID=UPI002162AFF0|nr:5'-nucleotidase C-terminal domain-containing protein [Cytobacillus firmus]MCS0669829.1 5'-nucleotidase C-terminal domain-containing protein [Cytobacillus firmus]
MHVTGLKLTYDTSKAAGDRIVSLVNNVERISLLNKKYFVTVNNYIVDGGDGYGHILT